TSKYGDPIATMGYTCESQGMPTNDWNNDIVLTTEATKTSNVGSNYSISATGANTNYIINVKEGSYYTITARKVTVSLSNASKTYDGKSYSTEIKTASDLVNNDTIYVKITTDGINVKTGGYVYNGTPTEQTGNFGDFIVSELSISSDNANYEITYVLSATIGKARVTIDNSEDYGSIIYNGNIYSQSLTKAIGINDEQVSFSAKTNSANAGVYSSVNTEENVLEISNVVVKDKNGTQIENGANNYEFDWKVSAEIEKNEITYTQTASALHGTIAEYTATKQENSHEFTDLISGHTISVTFAVNENVEKGTYNYNVKYVGEVDDESADFTSIILEIKDGDTDVTSNYDVTLSLTFIISEFRVVADPVTKVYDGNMHFVQATLANDDADKIKSIEYRVKNSNGEWGDWLNDSPKYSEAMSAAVEVGFKIVVAVDDNAENDIEIISSTTIKINPRPVTVSFSNESNPKIYDGNVFSEKIEIETDLGHALSVTVSTKAENVNVGTYVYNTANKTGFNTPVATIKAGNDDVTSNYTITYDLSATITAREINVAVDSEALTKITYGDVLTSIENEKFVVSFVESFPTDVANLHDLAK
ncbi:MAG: hypothetical protein IKA42_06540, partial [Clostridia bacterium]|nr:hypothetical protein [Clostridia bacterium]